MDMYFRKARRMQTKYIIPTRTSRKSPYDVVSTIGYAVSWGEGMEHLNPHIARCLGTFAIGSLNDLEVPEIFLPSGRPAWWPSNGDGFGTERDND